VVLLVTVIEENIPTSFNKIFFTSKKKAHHAWGVSGEK
jgi:hypothetical protein